MEVTYFNHDVILDGTKIGVSILEHSDISMGVVFGKLSFESITSGYDFMKSYCLNNKIAINEDLPEDKFIITSFIPNLKVLSSNRIPIVCQGINIEGMDSESFDIILTGIPFEQIEQEFPHHFKK